MVHVAHIVCIVYNAYKVHNIYIYTYIYHMLNVYFVYSVHDVYCLCKVDYVHLCHSCIYLFSKQLNHRATQHIEKTKYKIILSVAM